MVQGYGNDDVFEGYWKVCKVLVFDECRNVRVNSMLNRDSVVSRLNSSSGLSFTEFTYQILQAYDYYYLHSHYNCVLQVGGNDQWGNITAGCELIRKLSGHVCCCSCDDPRRLSMEWLFLSSQPPMVKRSASPLETASTWVLRRHPMYLVDEGEWSLVLLLSVLLQPLRWGRCSSPSLFHLFEWQGHQGTERGTSKVSWEPNSSEGDCKYSVLLLMNII